MKRAFVQSQLPADLEGRAGIIDSLMDAHGAGIEAEKEKTTAALEKADNLNTKVKELEDKLTSGDSEAEEKLSKLQAELDSVKADLEKSKADLTAEKADHLKTKEGYATEKDDAAVDELVRTLLGTADENGEVMLEAAIPKVLKIYDRSIVECGKDGAISNADKVLEHIKGDWKDFFGKTETKGAAVGNAQSTTPGTKNPWLKDSKNLTEQTRIAKEDPQLAVQLAKAAGITLSL